MFLQNALAVTVPLESINKATTDLLNMGWEVLGVENRREKLNSRQIVAIPVELDEIAAEMKRRRIEARYGVQS